MLPILLLVPLIGILLLISFIGFVINRKEIMSTWIGMSKMLKTFVISSITILTILPIKVTLHTLELQNFIPFAVGLQCVLFSIILAAFNGKGVPKLLSLVTAYLTGIVVSFILFYLHCKFIVPVIGILAFSIVQYKLESYLFICPVISSSENTSEKLTSHGMDISQLLNPVGGSTSNAGSAAGNGSTQQPVANPPVQPQVPNATGGVVNESLAYMHGFANAEERQLRDYVIAHGYNNNVSNQPYAGRLSQQLELVRAYTKGSQLSNNTMAPNDRLYIGIMIRQLYPNYNPSIHYENSKTFRKFLKNLP